MRRGMVRFGKHSFELVAVRECYVQSCRGLVWHGRACLAGHGKDFFELVVVSANVKAW
jgi:hypothetical protein